MDRRHANRHQGDADNVLRGGELAEDDRAVIIANTGSSASMNANVARDSRAIAS